MPVLYCFRKPFECQCAAGYRGLLCTECIPSDGCIHGTCHEPGECICNKVTQDSTEQV